MGLMQWLGLQKRGVTLSSKETEAIRFILGGNYTASGKSVTIDNSMGIPALWAGFRLLGHTFGSLPFDVFERTKEGEVISEDHELSELLSKAPNQLYNSFSWKEMMQVNLESYGNAYSRIHRSRTGEITEIEWLDPNMVAVLYNPDKRLKKYKQIKKDIAGKTKEIMLDHDEVLHLMMMSKDGIIGQSPINACKEALGMMLSAQEWGASYFGNGALPSGVFSTPASLTPEQVLQYQELWRKQHQGAANSGNVAILHSGATYQQISATPVDADFVKTMNWSGVQVCQILGIPPHLLGILDRATNNNIEQQSIDNVVHCIRPRAKAWEVECNHKFFLTEKTRKKYFVRFNLDSLLRGDTAARGEFYSKLFNIGVLSPNDIRKQEHLNPRPGGDEYYVQVNMGGNQTKKEEGNEK